MDGYLVLNRKEDESVTVFANGERIEVIVSRVKGNRVSLAFKAGESVRILRTELVEQEPVA
jgi:carbon storage regulator CsrA